MNPHYMNGWRLGFRTWGCVNVSHDNPFDPASPAWDGYNDGYEQARRNFEPIAA